MAQVGVAIALYALGRVANKLLTEKSENPIKDETPPSLASKGSFIQLLVGVRRISPFIAWTGNRVKAEEPAAGGKGINTGGATDQIVWYEDGIHVLCVGPSTKLHAIKINGKNAKFNNGDPIDSENHPSGSSFITNDGDEFEVYWGGSYTDEPDNDWIGDPTRLGLTSKWPWMMIICWKQKRLGGFPTWGNISYDVENRPYITAIDTSEWGVEPWINKGIGPNGNPLGILGTNNSSLVGDPVDYPYLKVWNSGQDATAYYIDHGYCEVTGQPIESVNKIYSIQTSFYDQFETHVQVREQDYKDVPNGVVEHDLTLWNKDPFVVCTKLTSDPPSSYPSGFTNFDGPIYNITNTSQDLTGSSGISVNTVDVGGGEDFYAFGGQKYIAWIKGVNNILNWCGFIELSMRETGTPSHKVFAKISRGTSGELVITSNNEAIVELKPAGNNWDKLIITYKTGKGSDPLYSTDRRQLAMLLNNPGIGNSSHVHIFYNETHNELLEDNPGFIRTGITTIKLGEPLLNAVDDEGEVEGYAEGFGEGGPNPAFTIAQLLFEDFPHGRKLNPNDFDLDTLRDLAILCEEEGMILHLLLDNGKKFSEGIAILLQDLYAYITFDYVKGKYVFGAIREGDTVQEFTTDILADAYPEHENVLDPDTSNLVLYTFNDNKLGYRSNTRPVFDDASSADGCRSIETIAIETATDLFVAMKIAQRRRQELLVPGTVYKFTGKNEARSLTPGALIRIEGFPAIGEEENLRVTEITPDTDSSNVSINAITDIFSISAGELTTLGPLGGGANTNTPTASQDLYTQLVELPISLSNNEISVTLLRIPSNGVSTDSGVIGSITDIDYHSIGRSFSCFGGLLISEFDENTTDTLTGDLSPAIIPVGGRNISGVPALSDIEWENGSTLVYINGEIFSLKKITPVGDGSYLLDGLIRAQHGTSKVYQMSGSVVYIFKLAELRRYTHPMFTVGQELYVKTVHTGVSLTSANKSVITLQGIGKQDFIASPTTANLRDALVTAGILKPQ